MRRKMYGMLGLCTALVIAGTAVQVPESTAAQTQDEDASAEAAAQAQDEDASEESDARTQDGDASDKVADASEMTEISEVLESWMKPIYADALVTGTYEVEVNCSSSMFPIIACTLRVQDGKMEADMTLNGDGYLYVYPAAAEEAAEAPKDTWIPFTEDADGHQVYTIPVEALDAEVKCASYSRKKEKWYDRSLAFLSTSLPKEAFQELSLVTAADLALEDGAYTVDAVLSGGSGKASIASPAALTIEDGQAFLEVVFSSPNYDYMLVEDEKYERTNSEGDSVFVIPVPGFDYQIPVIADTTAMSKPHEISYTIYLDPASITAA